MSEAYELSLAEAAAAVEQGTLSPVELVSSVLERCEAVDDRTGAFVALAPEPALAAARAFEAELARGQRRGPLHGIPVAIKEVIDDTAPVVNALRDAGAVVIGATRSHALAFGVTTPGTFNPWNLDHSCGGSSGGSAAAVAAGQAMLALGTDTGGSIRGPASACGIVGLRPTLRLVSTHGTLTNSWTLDSVGPMTRTVRDTALALGALTGSEPAIDGSIAGLRIGLPDGYFFDRVEPEVADAVRAAAEVLAAEGAELVEFSPPLSHAYMAIVLGIQAPEISAVHARRLREEPERLDPAIRVTLEASSLLPARAYVNARRARRLLIAAWRPVFERVDTVIAPTYPVGAPLAGRSSVSWPDGFEEPVWETLSRLTVPASLLGAPDVSVPCGTAGNGLPCGMQIIGRPSADDVVLTLAHAYERTGAYAAAPGPDALVVDSRRSAAA
jgi:aspartyl-tRNA(Asn)/glutamyl-tRNA(Gln) amidotransferase subunit A